MFKTALTRLNSNVKAARPSLGANETDVALAIRHAHAAIHEMNAMERAAPSPSNGKLLGRWLDVVGLRASPLLEGLDHLDGAKIDALLRARAALLRLREFERAGGASLYLAERVVALGRGLQVAGTQKLRPGPDPIPIDDAAFLEDVGRDYLPAAATNDGRAEDARELICKKHGISMYKFFKLLKEARKAGLLDSHEPRPAARAASTAKRVR